MKFANEIKIKLPVNKVVELFDNPDNLKLWMKGLKSFEHISGTPGQPGAKSRLVFEMGKRKMEMIETVTVRNLPHEFSGTYETNGVVNLVKNKFIAESDQVTHYISEQEFQFSGFMKIIAFLMSGTFKKQSMKYLEDFKSFAESHRN